MKYPKGKIKRVFLEYADRTMELTGEEAAKWKEMAEAQAMIGHVHGWRWPELNWDIKLKEASDE